MIYYLHDCIPTSSPLEPCSRIPTTVGCSAALRCLFRDELMLVACQGFTKHPRGLSPVGPVTWPLRVSTTYHHQSIVCRTRSRKMSIGCYTIIYTST